MASLTSRFRPALLLLAILLIISACVVYVSASSPDDSGADTNTPPPPVTPLDNNDDDDDEDLDDFGDDDDVDLHISYTPEDDLDEEAARIAAGLRGITSHPDVHPSAFFPGRTDNTLVLGEVADMLLGFRNDGDIKFTVAAIRGYIVNPPDWTFPIQNLTGFGYNVSVLPEETATLYYRFLPSERLAPREFGVVVEVFYTSERNATFMTTFFNQTVMFVEPEEGFGLQSLASILTLLALILGGAYLAFHLYAPKSLKDSVNAQLASAGIGPKSMTSKTSSPTRTSDPNVVDEEWLPAHLRKKNKKGKNGKK